MSLAAATVILNGEAVAALSDVRHPKHRGVLPYVEGAAQRRSRNTSNRVLVPVAVRAEAGWDRADPQAAVINRPYVALAETLECPLVTRDARIRRASRHTAQIVVV